MSEEKYKAGFLNAEQDCRNLEEKIEALQKENDQQKATIKELKEEVKWFNQVLSGNSLRLVATIKDLAEAVEFYADGVNNWDTSQSLTWSCILPSDVEHIDNSGFRLRGGKRARQALEKNKEMIEGGLNDSR